MSLSALETAASACYPASKLEDVDERRRRRYFEPCAGRLRVRNELHELVVYDFHNLKHENGLRNLDVIFCRNVLIYFDRSEQAKVVDKLVRALEPGGYLFLGHSESVQGMSSDLEFVHERGGTAYRKARLA